MQNSPTHSFEQEFAEELEIAWKRLVEAKKAIIPLHKEIQAWETFQQVYNTHLAITVEARRALEQRVEELLMEREHQSMTKLLDSEDDYNNLSRNDDTSDNGINNASDDSPQSKNQGTPSSGFKRPNRKKKKKQNNEDIEQNEKSGEKIPKDWIADHFVRLYKLGSERESVARSDDAQPFSVRMRIINEIKGDNTSNEVDLLIRMPFNDQVDVPRWKRGLSITETRRPESDPERLYRFRLWTRLLEQGYERLVSDLASIRRSAIYDDFEVWKQSDDYEPTIAIERARERHEAAIAQLEKQIKTLIAELEE